MIYRTLQWSKYCWQSNCCWIRVLYDFLEKAIKTTLCDAKNFSRNIGHLLGVPDIGKQVLNIFEDARHIEKLVKYELLLIHHIYGFIHTLHVNVFLSSFKISLKFVIYEFYFYILTVKIIL